MRNNRSFMNAFGRMNDQLTVVSVSPWLESRARRSPILGNARHLCICNSVNTEVFHPSDACEALSEGFPEGSQDCDGLVVLHVTPHFTDAPDDLKGGAHIIELALRLASYGIKVFVAGRHDIQGHIPDNMVLLGEVSEPSQLARYYASADLTVIASKQETFSMVCAESLCCGTPVVGFRAGGPESVVPKDMGAFVAYADDEALAHAALECLNGGHDRRTRRWIAQEAKHLFSPQMMVEHYEEAYDEVCGRTACR